MNLDTFILTKGQPESVEIETEKVSHLEIKCLEVAGVDV